MPRDSRTLLTIGFTVILGLMFLVAIVGLSTLYTSSDRIKQLVSENYTKSSLIHEMRTAGRERTLSLQNMLIQEDPFRQDEEWMRINAYGAQFAAARIALTQKNLTAEEQRLLDDQSDETRFVGQQHLEIAELIMQGDKAEAHRVLEQTAIPRQHRVFELLSELLTIQTAAGADAVEAAERGYRTSLAWTLTLLLGIAGLSLLVARFVIRRTAETEERLHAATEHAQVTLHSIGDAVIATDTEGRIAQMNPEAERLTGWRLRDVLQRRVDEVFAVTRESAGARSIDPVGQTLRELQVAISEPDALLRGRDGRRFAIEYTAAPIFNLSHNESIGAVLVFRDVTQIRLITGELAYQAKHDMLTGLMNRREFEQQLERRVAGPAEQNGDPHWLCYMDLDQFKLINDTCGHMAGDELLKQTSRRLSTLVRDADLLARMGGDEFAILLNHCPEGAAMQVVERMRHALSAQHFDWNGRQFSVSGSFGLVPITPGAETTYEVLSAADAACYVAKDEGRNRVHVYRGSDDAAARRTGEMHWVHRIKKAIDEDRLVLYHQNIAALHGTAFDLHTEILVRMLDEDGNLVPPLAFIPAAERYNLMSEIDRWVIRTALSSLQPTLARMRPGRCTIAINLSAQSLCDEAFLLFVLKEFGQRQVDPRHVCFEITETCAMSNLSRAMHFITTLRA
ncbi:MAG: diguanylate cyclase, partial [Thiohalobacteraceae bacterium]